MLLMNKDRLHRKDSLFTERIDWSQKGETIHRKEKLFRAFLCAERIQRLLGGALKASKREPVVKQNKADFHSPPPPHPLHHPIETMCCVQLQEGCSI